MTKITRQWAGVCIDGSQVEVWIFPAEGRVRVEAIGTRALSRIDRNVRLSHEDSHLNFALDEITVTDTEITCMARSDLAPQFKEGFSLQLEPGMAEAIRISLPQVHRVAEISQTIRARISALLEPPVSHMFSFVDEVVANIVLDGMDAEGAMRVSAGMSWVGKEERFIATFSDSQVQEILASAIVAPAH